MLGAGGATKLTLVDWHHLSTDTARFALSGDDHGLGFPHGCVVADNDHARDRLLRRGAERTKVRTPLVESPIHPYLVLAVADLNYDAKHLTLKPVQAI